MIGKKLFKLCLNAFDKNTFIGVENKIEYMRKNEKPTISHIPGFLSYCKKRGLSEKTHMNYKLFLNRFIKWLGKENKNILLPHELTVEDINSYKFYLSRFQGENGQPLKKVTQNYYLIGLRALLGYFTAKDIESPIKKL